MISRKRRNSSQILPLLDVRCSSVRSSRLQFPSDHALVAVVPALVRHDTILQESPCRASLNHDASWTRQWDSHLDVSQAPLFHNGWIIGVPIIKMFKHYCYNMYNYVYIIYNNMIYVYNMIITYNHNTMFCLQQITSFGWCEDLLLESSERSEL
jgi:hypothetical protein